MKTTLLIGLGSFIGGIGRYLVWKLIQTQFTTVFPYGTFVVNVVGCFLIGAVFGWSVKSNLDPTWQLFLTTGIMGGFTTFSAFSMETLNLMRSGHTPMAMLYMALSILVRLTGTMVGYSLMKL